MIHVYKRIVDVISQTTQKRLAATVKKTRLLAKLMVRVGLSLYIIILTLIGISRRPRKKKIEA